MTNSTSPKTISEVLREFAEAGEFSPQAPIDYHEALKEIERIMEDVIGEAPKGHIPDEECCDQCDLRADQRQRLKERL